MDSFRLDRSQFRDKNHARVIESLYEQLYAKIISRRLSRIRGVYHFKKILYIIFKLFLSFTILPVFILLDSEHKMITLPRSEITKNEYMYVSSQWIDFKK